MKLIKLSGRERSVLRAIDFTLGNTGAELIESTRLQPDDLVDILNGLICAGFMEMSPYAEHTTEQTLPEARFEVNPSYAQELRSAMARAY